MHAIPEGAIARYLQALQPSKRCGLRLFERLDPTQFPTPNGGRHRLAYFI
jgi:hypothetical protein